MRWNSATICLAHSSLFEGSFPGTLEVNLVQDSLGVPGFSLGAQVVGLIDKGSATWPATKLFFKLIKIFIFDNLNALLKSLGH